MGGRGQPGEFNPDLPFVNSTGGIPGIPRHYPLSNWTGGPSRMQFGSPSQPISADGDVWVPSALGSVPVSRAIWSSPIFDLTPQLRSQDVAQGGAALIRGGAARLCIEMIPLDTQNQTYNVYICERAHPWDPDEVRAVSAAQAVTQILGDGPPQSTTSFRPRFTVAAPETGMRYWQVFVIVDVMTSGAATPININLYANAY